MKKLISALLVAVLTVCVVAAAYVAVEKEKPQLRILVITDVHTIISEQVGDAQSDDFKAYDAEKMQKLLYYSDGVLQSAFDRVIEYAPDVLLITGDISDIGATAAHEKIAGWLKRVENAGIRVYVIPGNHDLTNSSYSFGNGKKERIDGTDYKEFSDIFSAYGYSEAIARDTQTASYVAELNDDYRLLAIDADECSYRSDDSERLLGWIKEQLTKAKEDGKTMIGMCHFPVLNHLGEIAGDLTGSSTRLNNVESFYKTYTEYGLKYMFVGHLHSNDIRSYTDGNGTYYEIETAALMSYPCPFREVNIYSERIETSTFNLDKINPDYMPDYVSDADIAAMTADFPKFALDYFKHDITSFCFDYAIPDYLPAILDLMGIDINSDENGRLCNEIMGDLITPFWNMPIYASDAAADELSLEEICAEYNITLPASDYKTVPEVVMMLLGKNYCGDENFTKGCVEAKLLEYGVYSIIYWFADYDLFGKLRRYSVDVPKINLKSGLEQLFTQREWNIVDNDLVGKLLNSIDFIKESGFAATLKGFTTADILNLFLLAFGEEELYGTKLSDVISVEKGGILTGVIFDTLFSQPIGNGLFIDVSPADNTLTIDLATNQCK